MSLFSLMLLIKEKHLTIRCNYRQIKLDQHFACYLNVHCFEIKILENET